ncbi:MAG: hypothetical protein KTR16_15155 [Acidiferrobacterales bacterium]|nr:hypothetical protein [Acidiferrobacterales bacterium]
MTQSSAHFLKYTQGNNLWLSNSASTVSHLIDNGIEPEVLATEQAVGQAMFDELIATANVKQGDINIALLGGRGGQALHRLLGQLATTSEYDDLFARLNVFTQDALAPMSMDNDFSFVRDFERILGEAFFQKINSFTPMQTDVDDIEAGVIEYLTTLESLGGLDIFFIGHGPEENDASHLAYIKPFSGAKQSHVAGIIPISSSILSHHISKFKAGGSNASDEDEQECRSAKYILTLGPGAILSAKKVVQSVVDADSAPAKINTYKNVLNTELSSNLDEMSSQLDANPGLWLRLHNNKKSFVLPNLQQ